MWHEPAMQSGSMDRVWSTADVVRLIEDSEMLIERRGPV